MDPQKLSQLDPKLREAYQRVMGTPLPQVAPASPAGEPIQAQTPPPPPIPTTNPIPNPAPEPEPEPQPIPTPQPSIPQPVSQPKDAITPEPPVQPANFVQMNSEVPASPSQNFTTPAPMAAVQTMAIKKKNGMMMPILFGIAGLIVIAVYTLFWAKIFNFKLPFLP